MYASLSTESVRRAPSPVQSIAAIIVNWNRADLTVKAVRSVQQSVQSVHVLDNASSDEDFATLDADLRHSAVTLTRAEANLGYVGGNNLAAKAALATGCDALLIMNNDALAEQGAIDELRRHLDAHPDVGVAMPTVLSIDGSRVLHGRCSFNPRSGTPKWEGGGLSPEEIPNQPVPTDYISGEAFLCRAKVVEQCGLFDERFFCYYEDVDWSVRVARAGWRLDHVPSARFRHELGGSGAPSSGAFYRARNRVLLQRYTFGRTRRAAVLTSVGPLALALAAHLRHGRREAARRVAAGLFAAMRTRDT
jgi:GT2 family glycosyltransferase